MYPLHSYLIACGLGLYFVIMSIIMMARANYYHKMIANMQLNSGTLYLIGALGLALGIALTLVHSLFVWDASLIVTLISWLILLKSILWLGFPECMIKHTRQFYQSRGRYYATTICVLLLGVILMAFSVH